MASENFSSLKTSIIGKTEEEAEQILTDAKHTMRVLTRDGQRLIGTMELRSNRVNVEVSNSVVTGILSIG